MTDDLHNPQHQLTTLQAAKRTTTRLLSTLKQLELRARAGKLPTNLQLDEAATTTARLQDLIATLAVAADARHDFEIGKLLNSNRPTTTH